MPNDLNSFMLRWNYVLGEGMIVEFFLFCQDKIQQFPNNGNWWCLYHYSLILISLEMDTHAHIENVPLDLKRQYIENAHMRISQYKFVSSLQNSINNFKATAMKFLFIVDNNETITVADYLWFSSIAFLEGWKIEIKRRELMLPNAFQNHVRRVSRGVMLIPFESQYYHTPQVHSLPQFRPFIYLNNN